MNGIACAGNWIIDHIKIVDAWPQEGALTTIRSSEHGIGGSPANVLTDLKSLGFGAPLRALGCLGDDEYGQMILTHCRRHDIDVSLLQTIPGETTSYTDVMTVAGTGQRTFFHDRGSNAQFCPAHVDLEELKERAPRIFHLGYLLLLDAMDAPDDHFGTAAAHLLHTIGELGIQTSIDVVSESSDRFQRIVKPALRFTDHCIVNEYEAEHITGVRVRDGSDVLIPGALNAAAAALLDLGVRQTVVIHCPEGGLWTDSDGSDVWLGSLELPPDLVVSAVGAGDAFCAGVLYGLHEGWDPTECLLVANATAATCLGAKNTTDGVKHLAELHEFAARYQPTAERGESSGEPAAGSGGAPQAPEDD